MLSECYYQMHSGRRVHVIEVMNRIKQVFVELNLVKGLKRMKMVEVTHKGRTTKQSNAFFERIQPEGYRMANGSPTH